MLTWMSLVFTYTLSSSLAVQFTVQYEKSSIASRNRGFLENVSGTQSVKEFLTFIEPDIIKVFTSGQH